MSKYKDNFKTKIVRDLVTSIFNTNSTKIFIATPAAIGSSSIGEIVDSYKEDNDIYDNILSLFKPTNLYYMIEKNQWVSGTVYDTYSSDINIKNKNFFASTKLGSVYDIFVCISNNSSVPSTYLPVKSVSQPNENIVTTDGYIWKLVYTQTSNDAIENNDTYLSILHNTTRYTSSGSVKGSIDKINITSSGQAFPYSVNVGTSLDSDYVVVSNTGSSGGTQLILTIPNGTTMSRVSSFYDSNEYSLLLYVEDTLQHVLTIDTLEIVNGSITCLVCENIYDNNQFQNLTYKIVPKIVVSCESGTGLVAYPQIDPTSLKINEIKIFSKGSDYSKLCLSTIGGYTLSAVFSPIGGLGFDPIYDLKCNTMCITCSIIPTDNYNRTNPADVLSCSNGFIFPAASPISMKGYTAIGYLQYGIIVDEVDNLISTTPINTNRNYTTLQLFRGTKDAADSTNYFFNSQDLTNENNQNGIYELVPGDYICQVSSSGEYTAHGQILGISFKNEGATLNKPTMSVKTLYGAFVVDDAKPIKKTDINRSASTVIAQGIKIYSLLNTPNMSKLSGRILHIENLTTAASIETIHKSKLILSI